MALEQTLIVFFSFVGFMIAFHIHHKQRTGEKLVCFVGRDCDAVIKSEYSSFLGISNTTWGMIYFAFVAVFHLAQIVYPQIDTLFFILLTLAITSAAFLFSLYLLFIQIFILRHWCEWCLVASLISALIFFLMIFENFKIW